MRPLLIVLTLCLLVVVSLAIGVFAADWPFWQRAWRWHAAAPAPPSRVPGAYDTLRASAGPRELALDVDAAVTAAVSELLDDDVTAALLVARDDRVLFEYYANGFDVDSRFDGRELSSLPLVALYGAAELRRLGPALDEGIGATLAKWHDDPRGQITPRQLLQGLSGLALPAGSPLNPFGTRARLLSGPNFERAATEVPAAWPPGSHFAANPADAQLAATVLAQAAGRPAATLLREWLVEPLGFGATRVLLDRRRGAMAAHCCVEARARDWLQLGLLLAQDGEVGGVRVFPQRYARELLLTSPVAPERALGAQRLTLTGGGAALLARGRGRLLLIDARARAAWLWFGTSEMADERVARLLHAAGLERPAR